MTKKIKLVAADLDGTMMRPNCTVSDYSKDVVRRFIHAGNIFVPTTGRCFRSTESRIGDVKEIRYFNCSNGCLVYDRQEDEILLSHTIPQELAYEIYKDVKELGGAAEIYSELDSYLEEDKFPLALKAFNKELSENLYSTTLTIEAPEEKIRSGEMKVNKFNLVFETAEDKEMIAKKYGSREDIIVTIHTIYNLEVFYSGCDKDTAIRIIEDREGVAHEDTVAIGDSINDMTMVKYAQLGAAVANSMEPLKEIADRIIPSNIEDGPAQLIEEILEE